MRPRDGIVAVLAHDFESVLLGVAPTDADLILDGTLVLLAGREPGVNRDGFGGRHDGHYRSAASSVEGGGNSIRPSNTWRVTKRPTSSAIQTRSHNIITSTT